MTMVYDIHIYWGMDFVHRPELKNKNRTFRKLDLFPFSGEGGRRLLCWVPQKKLTPVVQRLWLALLSDSAEQASSPFC
jgi:hypothetical protein